MSEHSNEQCADDLRDAWHDGRAAGRAEVAVILQDLIAELREQRARLKGYLNDD